MTSLSEVRGELLAQHADIRAEIDAVGALCATLPIDRKQLAKTLHRLIDLVCLHNIAEEEALRSVLPGLDVFGDVRKGVMISDHMAEHEDLRTTLVACAGEDSSAALASILALLERLRAHMEHEENLFLSARLFGQVDAPGTKSS